MPHISVLSSLIWRRRRCSQSSAQRHRTVPSEQRRNEHTGSAFVGRLPATFSSAHDDCVCRGSSAECFDIPFLVTLSGQKGPGATGAPVYWIRLCTALCLLSR